MIEIIYEDNDILLCHKPAGVATQTKRLGQQDMESLLKNYRAKKGEQPYIGVVHRLDQPVEGIMVFAKNQKATSALSKQIQAKMIGKYYYAVSAHKPEKESGVLEHYLITDKKTNFTHVVEETETVELCNYKNFASDEHAVEKPKTAKKEWNKEKNTKELQEFKKFAKLEYRVVNVIDERTLFDIKLHTGRQHQIRVQMAHMGCPLIGDEKYGTKAHDKLALCSYRLQFQHPTMKKQMDFSISPKGEAFQMFIK